MCGRKEDMIESMCCGFKSKQESEPPICPKCEKCDEVVATSDTRLLFKMFIAKPLDEFNCLRCECSF